MLITKKLLNNSKTLAEYLLKDMIDQLIESDECPFYVNRELGCEICKQYFPQCHGDEHLADDCPCDHYSIKTIKTRIAKFIKQNLPRE